MNPIRRFPALRWWPLVLLACVLPAIANAADPPSTGVAVPIETDGGEFELWFFPSGIASNAVDAELGTAMLGTIGQFVATGAQMSDSVSLATGFLAPGVSFDDNDIAPDDSADVELGVLAIDQPAFASFALGPVTPNPAPGRALLQWTAPRAARMRMSVHDIQGREVALLVDGEQEPGVHQLRWNGAARLAAGVYFLRLDTPDGVFTRRVVLTR